MSTEQKYEQLKTVIDGWKGKQGALMPVMHEAQHIFGCIEEKTQNFIAEHLGVSTTQIYGVATFYSQFTLQPRGKYTVGVCLGTACYVRGAQKVFDAFSSQLGIKANRTTPDNLFTLEATRCIGCCGLAPAIMVNEEVYGRLTDADVPGILEKYRTQG